jgi:hypothetical protein
MSSQQDATAAAVCRAHVEAWGGHDYDAALASLARNLHVVVSSVDPVAPSTHTTGINEYTRTAPARSAPSVVGSAPTPVRGDARTTT